MKSNHDHPLASRLAEFPAFFFFPYLLIYLFAWKFELPLLAVEKVFWGLHFVNLLIAGWMLREVFRKIKPVEWGFWILLAALLWQRGAYLEYPSDPWEHFRRLTVWNDFERISENPLKDRFAYFWGWTFIRYFDPIHQRSFLNFYSAFWQWIFCYQFARFCFRMGVQRTSLIPQVLGCLLFFGNGILNFRYYMLSSVPLAYVSYLSALMLCKEFLSSRKKELLLAILPLILLMAFNHGETIIFFMISIVAMGLLEINRRFHLTRRKAVLATLLMFLAATYALGYAAWFYHWFPYNKFVNSGLWHPQLTHFATFRVWDLDGKIFNSIALPGLIALGGSFLFFKRFPEIVAISWMQLLVLVFPVSAVLIVRFFHYDTPYRVLYTLPVSFLGVLLLEKGITKVFSKKPQRQWIVTSVLVVLLSIPAAFPWRGRGFFQIHRPKTDRSLVPLDQTAQWFFENRKSNPRNCQILSDDLSLFSLHAHLGKDRYYFDRANPRHFLKEMGRDSQLLVEKLVSISLEQKEVCGILIARSADVPPPQYSIIAMEGQLWPPQRGHLETYLSKDDGLLREGLINRRWKKIAVPPYYDLYEPPYLNDLPSSTSSK